mmetsp:Transcript_28738/g.68597  ORF Transcript_28738/g.68597 Transcript_28738/m.68597 type:complete len:163 (-) Transcript_28738:203-691(-)
MDRQMEATRREIDQRISQAEEEARRAEEEAAAGSRAEGFSRRGDSFFFSSSHEIRADGYTYFERTVTHYGPPSALPPAQAPLPSPLAAAALLLAAAYAVLAAAFNRGYKLTRYLEAPAYRAALVLLWPVFFLFSDRFRKEFKLALKGRRTGSDDTQHSSKAT